MHKKTKEKQAQQTPYKKQELDSKQIFRMPALYIQERANKGVCKPKADSEVRAIPPDGLHEFSLGQGCLKWEKLAGERCSPLRFSFSKKGTGRCGHRPLQIPLSATLTSQHKAHPSGAFSRGTRQLLCPVGHLLWERRLFFWLP